MKRRWPRIVLLIASLVLALVLIMLGAGVWLHSSGRLATLAQHLLHRLSGLQVTFETMVFPSWNTVLLTNVRLQQQIPGWLVVMDCPRLQAHYSVSGLFNKQVSELRLQQPQLELLASDTPAAVSPGPATAPRPRRAWPFQQLRIQHGTVRAHWHDQTYTVQQLEAVLRPHGDGHIRGEVRGSLDDGATLQVATEVFLGAATPTARLQLTATAVPLTLVSRLLSPALSSAWHGNAGTVQVEAALELQEHTLQGTLTTHITHLTAQLQEVLLQNASLSSAARVAANTVQQTLQLDGQARLHVERLNTPSALAITEVSLTGPWRLSYAPEGWHVTATPTLLSQAVDIGSLARMTQLSLTIPLQVQSQAETVQMAATPVFTAQTLHLHSAGQTAVPLRMADIHGQLSVHGTPATMEVAQMRLQTGAWHGTAAHHAPLLTACSLEGSGSIAWQRQQLILSQLTGTLAEVGSLRGSGIWHWASHSVQDLHVQLAVNDVTPLWDILKHRLPAPAHTWQTAGQHEIQLDARRLSLLPPRQVQDLAITWQVHNGAFSAAEGTYAGEHLHSTLQAVMAMDEAAGQYSLHGTLTVQPFALLIGTLFPALEENHLSSVVTFSTSYSSRTERLQLYAAGQFGALGMLTLGGTVHQPLSTPGADLQVQVRNLNLAQLRNTFVYDALLFPTLSQAQVQGVVNATLGVRHQPAALTLHGTVDLVQGQFQTARVGLQGVSLFLPVQLHYPLPQTAPEVASLSAESFGRLSLDTLRIGHVDLHSLSLRLAVWSDNIFVREAVSMPLLGGQLVIDRITAQHLLQPHRQVMVPLRLRQVDLQRLHRGAARLPLSGILDGDLPHLQIRGERLETRGALTVQVAGGVVRIFDLHGSEVFSTLPTFGCSVTTETPLSLRRLTDIYPIGAMGGLLDFSVTDFIVVGGEPTAFVLEFAVHERGDEEREITIRALNNLLFTTGSAKVAAGVFADTYRLPYRRFGAVVTLRHDTLQLRGKYHDSDGTEYFMQAPLLGGGVSIVNRVPNNGIAFRDFVQRLKATVLERPEVQVR
jgi:hypothetical protein